MDQSLEFIGAIGFIGLVGSGIFLFVCWTTYVSAVMKQQILKPILKAEDIAWFKKCGLAFGFFVLYSAVFLSLTSWAQKY